MAHARSERRPLDRERAGEGVVAGVRAPLGRPRLARRPLAAGDPPRCAGDAYLSPSAVLARLTSRGFTQRIIP
jgi:hypothetical protein